MDHDSEKQQHAAAANADAASASTTNNTSDTSALESPSNSREKDLEANGASAATVPESEKAAPEQTGASPTGGPPTVHDTSAIPDGGAVAWLQVVGGFSVLFNTWGNLNTFGIFQTYYESGDLFKANSSDIAWVGAVQAALLLSFGLISGPLYDRGYLRPLLIFGSICTCLAYFMLSLCHELWQVVLAQGFLVGIGGGCIFVPAVALVPTYFKKRLGLALGITAAGSSMGGVIYPIVFYRLIDRIGFGWTCRAIGFISLGTLIVPCVVMKMRVKPPRARAVFDPTAFKDPVFLLLVFGLFLGFSTLR